MTALEWAWRLVNEPLTSEEIVAAQFDNEVTEAELAVKLWGERLKFLRDENKQ